MSYALVPLCYCAHLLDAQAIRASCEALGIPTRIDGEHQRSVLGMFGAPIELRIMVPRSQLRLAYQLAVEIIPDLPEPEYDDEDGELDHREPLPLRRALPEDLVPYPDEPLADGEDADDDALAEAEDEDEDEDDLAELRHRRSLFGPRVGFGFGLLTGVTAMAAGRVGYGLFLVAVALGLAYLRVLPITEEPDAP